MTKKERIQRVLEVMKEVSLPLDTRIPEVLVCHGGLHAGLGFDDDRVRQAVEIAALCPNPRPLSQCEAA